MLKDSLNKRNTNS